jgi:hypothetical protein
VPPVANFGLRLNHGSGQSCPPESAASTSLRTRSSRISMKLWMKR